MTTYPRLALPAKWEGRVHYPLPLLGCRENGDTTSGGQATHAVLACVCGWRSAPLRFVSEPIPALLRAHRAHVLTIAPDRR